MLVLKTFGEYFFILVPTNFSCGSFKKAKVSPMIGHPKLPGGRFALELDLDLKVWKMKARVHMKTVMDKAAGRERFSVSMVNLYMTSS